MQILLAMFLLMVSPAYADAPVVSDSASTHIVKGDVLYWEEDELVVRDIAGREIRLRVNGETKIEGASSKLKAGDKIEARVSGDGKATTIVLQIPGQAR
ncbi:MAG TPA: hypothetical protein VFS39_02405 [Nitrospira sp.]|nr:hypothetical protein [Nitrospira sp.]